MESADQLFLEILRDAIVGYLRAVDQWEATYNAYYRMPGYGQTISPDMEADQREFEARRRLLEPLLPRARQLCLKYGLGNPFPGLLRISLGQHAPQQRRESAISRNERNAVMACLEQLTDACHGLAPTGKPAERAPAARPPRAEPSRFSRWWAIVAVVLCALLLIPLLPRWPFPSVRPAAPRSTGDSSYGRRSGAELRASWEAERRRESARYTDADLQRMVERLFVPDDPGRVNFHGLLYAGERPLPYLRRALEDPRTYSTVFSKTTVDELGGSPFARICALLDELRPAEAAPQLMRYLDHPDPVFRRQAAALLARIGTAQCVDGVKRALADEDHEVREYTLIGLMRGVTARRDGEFAAGIFPALEPLLNAGRYDVGSPAGVMMAADAGKAAPILESPRYFSVNNPQLGEILRALDQPGVKVPREILLPLLTKLEPLATKESAGEITYAAALILYARNPDDLAESRFRALMQSPSSTIAIAGAQGLEILAGIHAHDAVWDAYDQRGFLGMTKPQQLYFAVELYRDEVNNGGHNQYFYNGESDLYRVAIEGLAVMGGASRAAILSDAGRAFGPRMPGPTESERRDQMERFGAAQSRLFEAADQRFFHAENEPSQRLDVLLTLYALQHRTDFAGTSQAPKSEAVFSSAGRERGRR